MAAGPEGLEKFMDLLEKYEKAADDNHVSEVLMQAGEALAEDVHRLPKPRRRGAGYTHMLDSVTAAPSGKDAVLVSWGRYYGKFVEHGTKKMSAQGMSTRMMSVQRMITMHRMNCRMISRCFIGKRDKKRQWLLDRNERDFYNNGACA